MSGHFSTATAAPTTVDGLSVTPTPAEVTVGSGDFFTLEVTDTNPNNVSFSEYYLYGVPADWTVKSNGTEISPTSPDPVIYTVTKADAVNGKITVFPPSTYTGTLTVQLGRPTNDPNMIKDFDNGTFDYFNNPAPMLPPANTPYTYHDPSGSTYTGQYCSAQYGPCDGDYSIWPTANMNGPDSHYNNYWADIRSINNPMVTPDTATICQGWNDPSSANLATNKVQVTRDQAKVAGKIGIFNGSIYMSPPNDLVTTTVKDLKPNTPYLFSAHVANLSDDPKHGTLPVRTAAYARTSAGAAGVNIGSTNALPQQSGCTITGDPWTVDSGIIYTDSSAQLILSMRNFGQGGFGNDIGIDNMSLYSLAMASFDLTVKQSQPELTINKTSDPASGSTVSRGQNVTYTVTAKNSGTVTLYPVTVTDDLSGVLPFASSVGQLKASIGDDPTVANQKLTWTGELTPGQTVELTYVVQVSDDIRVTDTLTNKVVGSASVKNSSTQAVSNCVTGLEAGCYSTLHGGLSGLEITKTSDPVTGSSVEPGQTVTYKVVAENTGDVALNPVDITDDLSGVLASAAIVGTPTASSGNSPKINGNILTWSDTIAAHSSVTLTYQVQVDAAATSANALSNKVTGHGTIPGSVGASDTTVPSNCADGTELGCFSDLSVGKYGNGLVATKTSNPASGTSVTPGQVIDYTLKVNNSGTILLEPVDITDDLSDVLAHATVVPGSVHADSGTADIDDTTDTLMWSGALTGGQTVTITYQVKVGSSVAEGTQLHNAVAVSGSDPNHTDVSVPSNCTTTLQGSGCSSTVTVAAAGLSVTKESDPKSGSVVTPGQEVTYTITAKNTGAVPLDPVELTDDLADVLTYADMVGDATSSVGPDPVLWGTSLSWSGALDADQSVTVKYTVKIRSGVASNMPFKNGVTGVGKIKDNPDGPVPSTCTTSTASGCESTLTTGTSNLEVTKISDPGSGESVTPGQQITYTVTATNTGDTNLDPVVISDDLTDVLANATVISSSLTASIGDTPILSGNTLTWTGALASNESVTIEYKVTVNASASGSLTNKVTAHATNSDNPTDTVPSTCVYGSEDGCFSTSHVGSLGDGLNVTKTSDPASGTYVTPGTVVSYKITAKNTGSVPLTPVVVTDDLTYVLAHADMVGSAAASTGAAPTVSGNTLTWSDTLAAGQSVEITYKVKVKDGAVKGQTLHNGVKATGTNPGNPGEKIPSTCETGDESGCSSDLPVGVSGLSVTKVSSPANGTFVTPGQKITYTVTATNTGDVKLDPVTVTDDLSGVLSGATWNDDATAASGTTDFTGDTLTWTGSLDPGAHVVITYSVNVSDTATTGDKLANNVTATGTDPKNPDDNVPSTCQNGTEAGCSSTVNVGKADLQVTKASVPATGSSVTPGQTMTYNITATNTGDVTLSGVNLSDNLSDVLAHAQLVDGSLSATLGTAVRSGDNITWSGVLGVGQSVTVSYDVTVDTTAAEGDILKNGVVASATDSGNPDGSVSSTCEAATDAGCSSTVTVGKPGLAVTKTSDPVSGSKVTPGQVVTYTITAKNTTNVTLYPVDVTDDLTNVFTNADLVPGSLTASISPAATITNDTLSWSGSLDGGDTVIITYQVTVKDSAVKDQSLTNKVQVTGEDPNHPGDTIPSTCALGTEINCSSELTVGESGLTVTKTSSPASGTYVTGGQVITYTITAKNTGDVILDPVYVTDNLANVLSHATMVTGSMTSSVGGTPTWSGDTLSWSGALIPDQSVIITYKVKVSNDVTKGDSLYNSVVAVGTNKDNPDTPVPSTCEAGDEAGCSSDLPVGGPGLTVTKVSSPGDGSFVTPGQAVTYTITAKNTGDVDLYPVVVTDDLADVLKHAALADAPTASTGDAPDVVNDKLTWTGTLAKDESVIITYTVTINKDAAKGDKLANNVTATGTNPDNPGGDIPSTCESGTEDGCSSTVTVGEAKLQVTKTSTPSSGSHVTPGTKITYTIKASNIGDVTLNPVDVSDDLTGVLAHAQLVAGSLQASAGTPNITNDQLAWTGSIDAGKFVTITYQVVVDDNVQVGDTISNDVTATATDPGNPDDSVPSTCTDGTELGCSSTVTVGESHLDVTKTSSPASGSHVTANTVITYTIKANNTGDIDLNPVVVTDDLTNVLSHATLVANSATASIGGAPTVDNNTLSWSGSVPAGQFVTITYKVTVNPDVTVGQTITNDVTVTATNPDNPDDPNPSTCQTGAEPGCSSTVTVGEPGLTVTKVSDPVSGTFVTPGQKVTYTITAKNTGTVKLSPVVISDNLANVLQHAALVPGSLTSTLAPDPTVNGNALTWLGSLDPGQSVVVTYQVVISSNAKPGDELANHVMAQGTNPDNPDETIPSTCEAGTEADCSSDLKVADPGLTVTKVSDPVSGTFVAPGQQVTYTITAKNTGDVALSPVVVTDDLTSVFAHASLVAGSVTTSVTPAASVTGDTLTWNGALTPGQSVVITYKVTIAADAKNGDSLKNNVTAVGTNPDNPDETIPSTCQSGTEAGCSSDLPISEPGLTVSKTSTPPSGSYVTGGQTITYTITAKNTGQVTLYPVHVTDDLTNVLAHSLVVNGSMTASTGDAPTMVGNVLTWTGTLAAGQTVNITYKVKINTDVIKGQALVNKVKADGTNPDNPDDPIPSTCETGDESQCESDLHVGESGLTVTKASTPVSGSYVTGGQIVTYAITAKNTGDVTLDPVHVHDDLANVLSHSTLVAGSLTSSTGDAPTMSGTKLNWNGKLTPGQSVTITYKVKINASVTKGQTLVNKVTADGTNPDNPDEPIPSTCETGDESQCESDLNVGEPGLTVTKVSDPKSGSYVTPGQIISYTVTAKNTGDVALAPVVVSDDMANVLTHATLVDGSMHASTGPTPLISGSLLTWAGSLNPGQSVVITYQIKINMNVQKGDSLTNNVTAEGTNPDNPDEPIPSTCESGDEPDCNSDLPVGAPGLTVTKTSTPSSGAVVAAGATITYTITAKNTGDVTLNPVNVNDDLTNVLAHAAIVPGSLMTSMTPPASVSGNALTWTGSLDAGQTLTITYKVTVNADATKGDSISNHVLADGTNPANPDEPIPSTCTTGAETGCSSTVSVGETGLTVTKASNPASGSYVTAGQVVTYTITAKNTGEVGLNPVNVTDNLTNVMSHSTLVDGSITSSQGAIPTLAGNTLSWNGNLTPGQQVVITYKVKINSDVVKGQTLVNKVTAEGTNPDNPDDKIPTTCETGTETNCESDLPIGEPGLTVTKVSDPVSGSYVTPGQKITYKVTATNTGDVTLNPVVITDDMSDVLAHATLVADSMTASSGPVPTMTGNTLTWSGSLDSGKSVVVTYQIAISADAQKGDTLTNHVVAEGTNPDNPDDKTPSTCETGDESQCGSDLQIGEPGLTVTKISSPQSGTYVTAGQTVTYTITASNTGDITLNPVVVNDDLSNVLTHAQYVTNSLTASLGVLPTLVNNKLTWTGVLGVGQSVTITYKVVVAPTVQKGDSLGNNVTAEGTNPDNPDEQIPSTCTSGGEPDCSSTLPVGNAGLTVTKVSDPKSGSTVKTGQVVTYTITAKNTGDVNLNPVTVTDNLSNVFAHATMVGSPQSSTGSAPTLVGQTLTWKGALAAGQAVTITYQVKIKAGLKAGDKLINDVTAVGVNPDDPDVKIPSTCTSGNEAGCSSSLIPGGGNGTAATGGSVQGDASTVATAIAIVVALTGAAGLALSYRRRLNR